MTPKVVIGLGKEDDVGVGLDEDVCWVIGGDVS